MAKESARGEKVKFANITDDGKLTKGQVAGADGTPLAEKMKAGDHAPLGKAERAAPAARAGRGKRLANNSGLDLIDGGQSRNGSVVVHAVLHDIDRRLDALEADADRLLRRQDAAA